MKFFPIGGIYYVMLMSTFSTVNCNDIFINPWELKAPNQPYADHSVTIGDTITFFWSADENHTVYINPTRNCDDSGSILVGSDSPASYTFLESDAKVSSEGQSGQPVFFADNIAQLCEWGMRFSVAVNATLDGENESAITPTAVLTNAPTKGPTSYPTQIPADEPSTTPTQAPSNIPSYIPSTKDLEPSNVPTKSPSVSPSSSPSSYHSYSPSLTTIATTAAPTNVATKKPTSDPTQTPTNVPTNDLTIGPTRKPSDVPIETEKPTEALILSTLTPTSTPTFAKIKPTPDSIQTPTNVPTIFPTLGPTTKPSNVPIETERPTETFTLDPTVALSTQVQFTNNPTTADNTLAPEMPPKDEGENVLRTLTGLQMGMAGITDLPPSARVAWENLTRSFSTSYVFNEMKNSVSNFDTSYEVTDVRPIVLQRHQRMMRGNQRVLQSQQGVIVVYTQTVQYQTIDSNKFIPELLTSAPFETDGERTAYVTLLGTSSDDTLSQVTGVSEIQTSGAASTQPPASTPDNKSMFWTKPAIIGVACGGAATLILILIFCIYCCAKDGVKGDDDARNSGEPPLHVSVRDDEVSTLAGPQGGPPTYGDRSVATMDYDYSKAYGGAGDTSVSSAGGTFGSNTQNISLPTNTTLGALNTDDNTSYDAQYNEPGSKSKEEVLQIFAPPGKLGVVIDTPDDGAPVVHAVKESSVIADRIIVGDKLVAVDDEDVRSMTAIKVSKMISRKGANPSRKLTIIRMTNIED